MVYGGVVLGAASGCETRSKANSQARAAYTAGRQEGIAESHRQPQTTPDNIMVDGDVQNHTIPWVQGLMLSQALAAAEYQGTSDPKRITVTHEGEAMDFSPEDVLQGKADMPLEPGDHVDIVQ